MKSKKLISFLCAAAMTVSSFAGLAITASAAEVLSLDGTSKEGWVNSDSNNRGSVTVTTDEGETDSYLKAGDNKDANVNQTYTVTGATTSALGSKYVIEFDAAMHGSNGSGGQDSEGTQIAFYSSNNAADTREAKNVAGRKYTGIGKGFVLKYDVRRDFLGSDKGIVINDPATEVPNDWTAIDNYAASVKQDLWMRTRAVIDTTAKTATVTVINKSGQKLLDGKSYTFDGTGDIAGIKLTTGRSDPNNPSAAFINLDNVKIYSGEPTGDLTTDGLRYDAGVPMPYQPPAVKDAAPALAAPEGITPVVNQNFSADVNAVQSADAVEVTDLTGLKVTMKAAADKADASTYAKTADYATGDKVLEMTGGRFSNQGRGPVVAPNELLKATDGNSAVMAFDVNLTSNYVDGEGRLYILGTTRQAGDNQDGAYNAVMAVLATDAADDANPDGYTYAEGDDTGLAIKVEPYTWYKVGIVVSDSKYRIFVAKAGEDWPTSAQIDRTKVGVGDAHYDMADITIPYLAVTSGGGDTGVTYSTARIDNMLTYTGATGEQPRYLLPSEKEEEEQPPVETETHAVTITVENGKAKVAAAAGETDPFDAVLIHASYSNGKLTNVESVPVTGITTTAKEVTGLSNTIVPGDKLMVWDSLKGMVPYGSHTVAAAESTAKTITYPTVQNGTVTGPAGAKANDKVTLKVTPNAGYKLTEGSLKVTGGTTDITPTLVAGKTDEYEFTMPDANVTVAAAFEAIQYTITAGANITIDEPASKKATVGTTVKVTATAPADKTVEKVTYKGAGAAQDATLGQDGKYTFTMPAENVTVNAVLEDVAKYAITTTVTPASSATVEYTVDGAKVADPVTVAADKEVTVSAKPASGKKVTKIEWKAASAAAATDITSTAKFTMPAEAVTVTVTTEVQTDPTYTVTGTVDEGVQAVTLTKAESAALNGEIQGTTVTFTGVEAGTYTIAATAKTDYENVKIKVGGEEKTELVVSAAVNNGFEVTTSKKKLDLEGKATVTLKAKGADVSKGQSATLQVGDELTAKLEKVGEAADVTGTVTYAFSREKDGVSTSLVGANDKYTIVADDVDATIKVTATVANDPVYKDGSVTSETVTVTAKPVPVLPGELTLKVDATDATETSPAVGETLTATYTPSDEEEVTYAWSSADDAEGVFEPIDGEIDSTYEISGDMLGKYIKVTVSADGYQDKSLTSAVVVEATVPYAKGKVGTITYDDGDEAAKFVDFTGRATPSVAQGANGNTTKVEKITTVSNNHPAGAKFIPFTENYVMTGEAIKVSFDINFPNNKTWIGIAGNSEIKAASGAGDCRNNASNARIISVGRDENATLNVYTSTTDTTATPVDGTDLGAKWYHVEADVNAGSTKTVSLKVYDYKANNNYATATPLYTTSAPVGWRDATLTGVSGVFVATDTNGATINVDNVYINDDTFTAPIVVNSPDATVSPAVVTATEGKATSGQTITITPKTVNGKKVTAVKVNGEDATSGSGNYTYETKGTEEALNVTVEYARSDIQSVEVTGSKTTAKGEDAPATYTYTATVKDTAGYTFVNSDDIEVEWELKDGTGAGTVAATDATLAQSADNKFEATLTVPASLEENKNVKIIAKVKTKVGEDAYTEGSLDVKLVTEPVYGVSAAEVEGGTVQLNEKEGDTDIVEIAQSKTLVVKVTPSEGYSIKSVKYALNSAPETKKDISLVGSDYELAMNDPSITGDITVYVEFQKVTNQITLDSGVNDVKVRVNGEEKQTAVIGDTVTIIPTGQNKKVSEISVQKTEAGNDAVTATGNSFVMPGYGVTVKSATVGELSAAKYASENFDSFESIDDITTFGTFDEETGRVGPEKSIETLSDSDKYLKAPILGTTNEANKRTKDTLNLTKTIDLTTSNIAKIAFDVNLTPKSNNASKATNAEISLVNSDKQVLFAIRQQDKTTAADGKAAVYAGLGFNNRTLNGTDPVIGSDDSNDTKAWGNNEYLYKKLPTTPLTKDADQLAMAVDTWYHVELTLKDNKMTVTVKQKDGADVYTAELDISGLKKDIARICLFNDQASSNGKGSYVAINDIAVTETTYQAD